MDLALVIVHNGTRNANRDRVADLAARLTSAVDPVSNAEYYTIAGIAAAHTCRVYHITLAPNVIPANLNLLRARVIQIGAGAGDGRIFNLIAKRTTDEGMEAAIRLITPANLTPANVQAAYAQIRDQNIGYLGNEPFGRVVSGRFLRAIRGYLNDGGTFAELIEIYKARAAEAGIGNG